MTQRTVKAEPSSKAISQLLTPEEAAAALHVSDATLAVWRSTQRVSLKFVRIGRKILYREQDIEAFITERTGTQTTHCDQAWRGKGTAPRAKRRVTRLLSATR
jgi:excisionase family DNA binding protein